VRNKRPSTIWARANGRLHRIAGPARVAMDGIPPKPVKNAYPVGFWVPERIFVSPDGRTLLAEWSGECETQWAYFVAVASGRVRTIFGVYESTAYGWTHDGRARVRLASPIYAKSKYPRIRLHAGMYDVDPVTLKRTLEKRLPGGPSC